MTSAVLIFVVVVALVVGLGYVALAHRKPKKSSGDMAKGTAIVLPSDRNGIQLKETYTDQPRAAIWKNRFKDLDISTWHSSWKLPQPDHGCFMFRVAKPGGLIIALSTTYGRERWYEGQGYAMVVDDQNADRPKSWIGKLPIFTKEMPGSKINWGFKLPVPPECQDFWVVLYYGYMWLGTGTVPGRNLVLAAQDPSPISGVKYFGFGSWGRNIGWGCDTGDGAREQEGIVSEVRICEETPKMPMPAEKVSCECAAAFNCQEINATLLNTDLKKYFPRDYKGGC